MSSTKMQDFDSYGKKVFSFVQALEIAYFLCRLTYSCPARVMTKFCSRFKRFPDGNNALLANRPWCRWHLPAYFYVDHRVGALKFGNAKSKKNPGFLTGVFMGHINY
ncbi:hypothetical protein [Undibacterium sp. Ji49W]|uniref:hypothetical protein n=1 Tax=Undibacterium sp. Ji49W TaxID=3413040 RepID=UPI003BF2E323